jgi:hypothetical protein
MLCHQGVDVCFALRPQSGRHDGEVVSTTFGRVEEVAGRSCPPREEGARNQWTNDILRIGDGCSVTKLFRSHAFVVQWLSSYKHRVVGLRGMCRNVLELLSLFNSLRWGRPIAGTRGTRAHVGVRMTPAAQRALPQLRKAIGLRVHGSRAASLVGKITAPQLLQGGLGLDLAMKRRVPMLRRRSLNRPRRELLPLARLMATLGRRPIHLGCPRLLTGR